MKERQGGSWALLWISTLGLLLALLFVVRGIQQDQDLLRDRVIALEIAASDEER